MAKLCVRLFCFILFKWTLSQRKEVGILLGILPNIQEQNKWINPNTVAARN